MSSMCLNGRWRGFASATKRLATSMTDPGWADRARQLLETTAWWSASQLQEEWTPAKPVSSRTVRRILARNGLHGRIAAQKPALNKRQLRNHVAYAKAHSLMEGWTAENWIFQMNRQFSSIPSAANIVDDRGPSGLTVHPEDKFGGGKIMVWVTSNTEVPGRSVRWMVTLMVPNINRFLHPSTFPTADFSTGWRSLPYLRFHYEVSQGEDDQGPSGMASTVSRYECYWAYLGKNEGGSLEDQAKELGGALGCLQCGHPQRLHQQALWLSAKPDGNCSAGQRNPYKILITSLLVHDEILDWFFICYFIYFLRKIKCIDYNLIDYYLRQEFCPGRNWLVHHYQAINLISIY